MDTKLTLSLDKKTIEQAKKYARKRNTSLSKLIENFLTKITAADNEDIQISPLVKSLSGVIQVKDADKKGYADHLTEKYKS